ncbi:hypothetical protein L195_g055250, partial [Trifolium pratense]
SYNPNKFVDDDHDNMEVAFHQICMEEKRRAKIDREEDEREMRLIEEEMERELADEESVRTLVGGVCCEYMNKKKMNINSKSVCEYTKF